MAAVTITSRLKEIVGSLLGISSYSAPKTGPELTDEQVENIRSGLAGQLAPLPTTRTRWYLADLEGTTHASDYGDMSPVAQLHRASKRDGVLGGLMATRTSGLIRLPKRFRGPTEIVQALEHRFEAGRSVFEELCPPAELAMLAADGIFCGVGVGELLPVEGRTYPVFVRLDPEWLRYRWIENRWYYNSIAGPIPITPGDGHWVLYTPGGRIAPWQAGLWPSLGRAFINKEHALLHRSNYSAKLANPARVAKAPAGATETQRQGLLASVIAWGINSVFEMPPGWDVSLVESNGRGYEVFQQEIDTADKEMMIALAGQIVTVEGGSGFANADIHRTIRADLIKETADSLAFTLNTQVLPAFVALSYGEEALEDLVTIEYEINPAKDMNSEAQTLQAVGQGIQTLTESLTPHKIVVDVSELLARFGIPVKGDLDGDGIPNEPVDVPISDKESENTDSEDLED